MPTSAVKGFRHVFDASAVLAVLFAETGEQVVRSAGPGGAISAVNLSEVIVKAFDRGVPSEVAEQTIDSLRFMVVAFDEIAARRAAALRAQTRSLDISFADRACLALAIEAGVPVYTSDRLWAGLDLGLDVRLIR